MSIKNKLFSKKMLPFFLVLIGIFSILPSVLIKVEAATVDVFWINLDNTAVSGTTVRKTNATDSDWKAGAASFQRLESDGYVEVTIDAITSSQSRMLGLNNNYNTSSYVDINYAFYFRNDGDLYIYERGVQKASLGSYKAGDVFRVAVEGNAVKYYKNGSVVRTSSLAPQFPLFAQASFYHQNGSFSNVKLVGTNTIIPPYNTPTEPATGDVEWINLVHTSVVSTSTDTSVIKTGSNANNWDAAATSKQILPSGNGYIEFSINDTTSHFRMLGLNHDNITPSYTDIDHALYFRDGGVLWVYENGVTPYYTQNGRQWSYKVGDKFRIAVENGVVKYYKNGSVFYTSPNSPAYPLFVDTTFHTPNSKFTNVRLVDLNNYTASGNVFLDNNRNGIKDAGETNYTGEMSLSSSNGTVAANTDGTYKVDYLISGQTWTATTALPYVRAGQKSLVHNGYLYAVGGLIASSGSSTPYPANSVFYAQLNDIGSVGTWQSGQVLPQNRHDHALVTYNNYLYVIGGSVGDSAQTTNTVYYSPINADGSVGTWRSTTVLPEAKYVHSAVAHNGYLYVTGGWRNSSSLSNKVYYAKINSDGSIGSWATGIQLPQVAYGHSSFVFNNYLYVVGGASTNYVASNKVFYARINSDGSIGSWATGTQLPQALYKSGLFLSDGYVFVIGGSGGKTVYYSKLNSDGSIGSWIAGPSTPTAIYNHSVSFHNGHAYILGGSSNNTAYTATSRSVTTAEFNVNPLTIALTSLPADYSITYPLNGPPPTFSVSLGNICNTNGANGATCSLGNMSNLNFGVSNLTPWIQSTCGDMAFDNGINNPLPPGASSIITDASCTTPGIVFAGDGAASFGKGQASSRGWVVGGGTYPEVSQRKSTEIFSSYTSLSARARQAGITPIDLASICVLSNCTLPLNLASGVYKAEGDVHLNAYTFSSGKNYAFLINGDLYLKGNVLIAKGSGSSSIFSASGNILVDPLVGTTTLSSTASNLDGYFSAGKSFIVNSLGACPDRRLNIAGTVIVNASLKGGSFQNNRSLCAGDATYPTISFTPRLDMLLSAPPFITQQVNFTTEVAP